MNRKDPGTFKSRWTVAVAVVATLCLTALMPAAAEQVEITLWHYQRNDASTRAVVEAFERRYPNIKVNLAHMGALNGENFFVAAAAGVGPDIVWADGPLVTSWALGGYIQPLTPWIERAGLSRSDFVPSAWDQAVWNGEVWALPLYVDSNFGLAYNRDMLDAAGVVPPTTIAELDDVNLKLAEYTSDGVLTRIGLIPWYTHGYGNSVYTWGWAFGGSFYDPENRRITANDPQIVAALEWMATLAERFGGFDAVQDLLSNLESGYDSLMSRRVAMRPEHMGVINSWIRARTPDLNFGLAPMPYLESAVDGPQNWVGGFTLVMSSASKHPDEAFEFIRFVTADPEGTEVWSQASGNFPGYLGSPAFERLALSDDFAVRFFAEILSAARHARPPIPNQGTYYSQLNNNLVPVLRGEVPAQQMLDEVTRVVQLDLDRILAEAGQ